jgi:hypothetical protein
VLYAVAALLFFTFRPGSTDVEFVDAVKAKSDPLSGTLARSFATFEGAATTVRGCASVSPLTSVAREDGREHGAEPSFDDHVVSDISLFTSARHPAAPDTCIPFVFVGMDRGEYKWGGSSEAWYSTASSFAAVLPNCSVALVAQEGEPRLLSDEAAAAALADTPLFIACVAGIPVSDITEAKGRMDAEAGAAESAVEPTDPSAYEL